MFSFKKLFRKIILTLRGFSKKVYTRGLVIISSGIITVLLLGTNGFIVSSKEAPPVVGEENNEKDLEEVILVEEEVEESSKLKSLIEQEDLQSKDKINLKSSNSYEEEAIIYSEEDYNALVNIVEAEATGEDVIGKIMVANVVLNRVKSSRFPNSIVEVVYQRNKNGVAQFSPISDGRMGTLKLTDDTYKAVERALKGEDYSKGALFFVARSISSEKAVSWFDNNLAKVAIHGVHEFYSYR